jgi:hypothetical protein
MRYLKTKNTYKASNVEFDATNIAAWSYGRWKFVSKIDGIVVFNTFRYSHSTTRHQSKVRSIMHQLGIRVDLYVDTPKSLSDQYWPTAAVCLLNSKINTLIDAINKKGSKSAKNAERREQISYLTLKIADIEAFEKTHIIGGVA